MGYSLEQVGLPLVPAKAGTQTRDWIPAFAGMSGGEILRDCSQSQYAMAKIGVADWPTA